MYLLGELHKVPGAIFSEMNDKCFGRTGIGLCHFSFGKWNLNWNCKLGDSIFRYWGFHLQCVLGELQRAQVEFSEMVLRLNFHQDSKIWTDWNCELKQHMDQVLFSIWYFSILGELLTGPSLTYFQKWKWHLIKLQTWLEKQLYGKEATIKAVYSKGGSKQLKFSSELGELHKGPSLLFSEIKKRDSLHWFWPAKEMGIQ